MTIVNRSMVSLYGAMIFSTLICVVLVGCGEAKPYLPASGTVKFDDGTVPQGDLSSITFQPKSTGPATKGAQGSIEPDGSFVLHTERPGDGAKPGEYSVTIHAMVGYPKGKSVVPAKYSDPRKTPLTAEVKAGDENHFEFILDKP